MRLSQLPLSVLPTWQARLLKLNLHLLHLHVYRQNGCSESDNIARFCAEVGSVEKISLERYGRKIHELRIKLDYGP